MESDWKVPHNWVTFAGDPPQNFFRFAGGFRTNKSTFLRIHWRHGGRLARAALATSASRKEGKRNKIGWAIILFAGNSMWNNACRICGAEIPAYFDSPYFEPE
jgi:hypothetical protein